MFSEALTFLQDQLKNNNVFSGVALVGAMGGIIATLRNQPVRIYNWCAQRLFMEFEIMSRDSAFDWLEEWLAAQPYTQNRARWLSVKTIRKGRRSNELPTVLLSPAPGTHWLFWKGYFLIVRRERKDDKPGTNSQHQMMERETFVVKILTRNRKAVLDLLYEARSVATPPDVERVEVLVPDFQSWDESARRLPRAIESVILPEGMAEGLVADIETFLASEHWYTDRGIPYRRGYLLHGPPGSGKSSIVFALASHLKLDICILSLGDSSLGDKDVRTLLGNVPPNSLVLIEDIDCVFNERKEDEDKDNKVTFSGLLNALDGVVASEGTILFMTSNHLNKLDEALIRPGRCDVRQFIGLPNASQVTRLFNRFYPEADAQPFVAVFKEGVSMATLQGHFLKYRDSADAAIANAEELQ